MILKNQCEKVRLLKKWEVEGKIIAFVIVQ